MLGDRDHVPPRTLDVSRRGRCPVFRKVRGTEHPRDAICLPLRDPVPRDTDTSSIPFPTEDLLIRPLSSAASARSVPGISSLPPPLVLIRSNSPIRPSGGTFRVRLGTPFGSEPEWIPFEIVHEKEWTRRAGPQTCVVLGRQAHTTGRISSAPDAQKGRVRTRPSLLRVAKRSWKSPP